ncbi:MAG: UDP-N-acetylmuramate dehydrogenase [Oceanicoccus sp.]|jgi:UDP-N-acetylmuramate dehydrogenase
MEIFSDHDLSNYGTYRIGGFADFFVEAKTEADLIEALEWAVTRDLPYFVFGGASNLLFDDEGFRGLVIRNKVDEIKIEDTIVHVAGGTPMPTLVRAAHKAGLTGLAEWNGLPGTVGGAIYGNAGCFEVEMKDLLLEARIWTPGEGLKTVDLAWFDYKYRESKMKETPGAVILSGKLKLSKGDPDEIEAKMKEIQQWRIKKQAPGLSTGSFFKNPAGAKSAGQLIDEAGLKGYVMGPMKVSEHHANFFMNTGGATSADVNALAEYVQMVVQDKHKIDLEREVISVPVMT